MKYVTPKVAAGLLGVHRSTISRWRKDGTLSDYRKVGNKYLYSLDSVKKLGGDNLFTSRDVIVSDIEDVDQ